jgi:ParB-like nuclease domain
MVDCQSLPIAKIYVPIKRRGALNSDLVREIAESMLEIGQQEPILVRRDGERFVLIDGFHRLEACKALGEEKILGVLASPQDRPRALSPYESEIDILRQKTARLRQLRLAKEAAEPSSTASAATEKATTYSREKLPRNLSSRSRAATLAEWLAERKKDGSSF